MKKTLKISVITVCKNAEETICETIKSVVYQSYKNIEYIIIDGGSRDKTVSMINKYRSRISYFVSKPDAGIYDAMNKGIKRASGEYCLFMNANDEFYDLKTLDKLASEILKTSADIVFGDMIVFNPLTEKSFYMKYREIDKSFLYYDNIPHQSSVFRTDLFQRYGMYDNSYSIMGDYEWLLRAFATSKISIYYANFPVARFSIGGVSTSQILSKKRRLERENIRRQYFSSKERFLYRMNPFNAVRKIRMYYNLMVIG